MRMKLKPTIALFFIGYIVFVVWKEFFYADIEDPILIWWTPFILEERFITCGDKYKCFMTSNRKYADSPRTKFLLFYGSKFNVDNLPFAKDLPWAIFHEESPKNLVFFMDKRVQSIFDITATFSRYSSFPMPLQYLKNITLLISKDYYKETSVKNELLKELAPVFYLQSDCDTPIGRDVIVKELMKYIEVDSYGPCLNNKMLPSRFRLNGTYDLYEPEFMHFVSRYKFVIAIENAKCNDYITEKLWRPLIVGSIPIYLGSPTIKDWLPNNHSFIHINDFKSIRMLADFIIKLNNNDELYNEYMMHKSHNTVTNMRLVKTLEKGMYGYEKHEDEYGINSFECYVCENVYTSEYKTKPISNNSVYDCKDPHEMSDWLESWENGQQIAKYIVNRFMP